MAIRSEDSFSNFIMWSVRATEHARTGYDEDALMNVRKAGEAAAKTIIAHQWAGIRADDAIAGARYVDLIGTIIRGRLAPKATILLLQTLQVEGNVGSHDERVRRGRVALGMAALEELAKWLCSELLGRSTPAELRMAFDTKRDTPATPVVDQPTSDVQQQRMAGIEAAISDLAQRSGQQNEMPDPGVIEAIKALHTRLDAMERPQQEDPPLPAEKDPEDVPGKKRQQWKWMAFAAAVLVVVGVAWWIMRTEAE